jgi:hypothetical protein
LNGGVKLMWKSKGEEHFGLAFFIGTAFRLMPD